MAPSSFTSLTRQTLLQESIAAEITWILAHPELSEAELAAVLEERRVPTPLPSTVYALGDWAHFYTAEVDGVSLAPLAWDGAMA